MISSGVSSRAVKKNRELLPSRPRWWLRRAINFLAVLVDHDVQCGVASELHLLKGRVPLVWADWMKVYLHEKKAIARSEELRSVQIQDALDARMRSRCFGGPRSYTLCVSL